MTRHPARWPLWLRVVVVALLALVEHRIARSFLATPHASPAFFGFLFALVGLIWDGLQAALDAIVYALVATVQWILAFLALTYNALLALGKTLATGFKAAWGFFRTIYDDVLKPAWDKFWQLFDKVRKWLNDTFGPVFKFLHAVRDDILCFYKTWIRPVLDTIDATRGILRVLEALHVPFAAAIDRQLTSIENWVNHQFERVLSAVNQVTNLLNRIVTADGLLQRLAFIRTYVRDIDLAFRALHYARLSSLSTTDRAALDETAAPRTARQILDDFIEYSETGGGRMAPTIAAALAGTEDTSRLLD